MGREFCKMEDLSRGKIELGEGKIGMEEGEYWGDLRWGGVKTEGLVGWIDGIGRGIFEEEEREIFLEGRKMENIAKTYGKLRFAPGVKEGGNWGYERGKFGEFWGKGA